MMVIANLILKCKMLKNSMKILDFCFDVCYNHCIEIE